MSSFNKDSFKSFPLKHNIPEFISFICNSSILASLCSTILLTVLSEFLIILPSPNGLLIIQVNIEAA